MGIDSVKYLNSFKIAIPMLTQITLNKLSHAINKILATDPLALKSLAELHPKTLAIHFEKIPFAVWVEFRANGIALKPLLDNTLPTVSLSGSPSALLRFAKTDSHTQMLMDKKIKIHGDLDVLMTVKKIQHDLIIDWEGLLAEYLGDFPANRLMSIARRAKRKLFRHLGLLKDDSLNYLHHEIALLPTAPEVEQFYQEIRELRRDIDHFAIRLKRMKQKNH